MLLCRLEGGGGSLGVFPLIDEACRMPRATYQVRAPMHFRGPFVLHHGRREEQYL